MEHMIHKKFGPSTDLWVCAHGVAYPDLCAECPPAPPAAAYACNSALCHLIGHHVATCKRPA